MSEFSKQYREKLLPGQKHAFADTDPEFAPGLWPSWPPCWAARGWTNSR